MSDILNLPTHYDLNDSLAAQFRSFINAQYNLDLSDYESLHSWSITAKADFWRSVAKFCNIKFNHSSGYVLTQENDFLNSIWFEHYTLNYAENLLQNQSDDTAIYFKSEDKISRTVSYKQLYDQVSSMQQYLKQQGVCKGDRVAGYLPNMPETIVCALATASLGAVWSSCSPDFGVPAVIDRFSQIQPKVFIYADYYFYNGKQHSCIEHAADISSQINSIETRIQVAFDHDAPLIQPVEAILYSDILHHYSAKRCEFVPVNFNDPLFIMYSSGTTGIPKCIVHGVGGTLIQHLKEHQLHADFQPGETVFYFTTCGWMMWNWLITSLASGCSLALYDGSPFFPANDHLWKWADDIGIHHFGTSAKYIDALKNDHIDIKKKFSLKQLRSISSTGSPLNNESYDYVYQHIKQTIRLCSISGGTDILSCFALGTPLKPIIKGQLQCIGLGMDVAILNEEGESVIEQKGELSCLSTFPSKPLKFWNDDDNSKYKSAYFEQFDNIWCHGDYAEITKEKGLIIYGRSDATLNPAGVRIGTAEIYRQVEKLTEIKESIVIGQAWQSDVRVVLFVVLNKGYELDESLQLKIKKHIREQTTARHVPAKILSVMDIPRTKSGKIVELAVTHTVAGETVKNLGALANPEALNYFKDRIELNT